MAGNTVMMGLAIVRLNCGDATLSALAFGGFILGVIASACLASPPGSPRQWSPRINLALSDSRRLHDGRCWEGQTSPRRLKLREAAGVARLLESKRGKLSGYVGQDVWRAA